MDILLPFAHMLAGLRHYLVWSVLLTHCLWASTFICLGRCSHVSSTTAVFMFPSVRAGTYVYIFSALCSLGMICNACADVVHKGVEVNTLETRLCHFLAVMAAVEKM